MLRRFWMLTLLATLILGMLAACQPGTVEQVMEQAGPAVQQAATEIVAQATAVNISPASVLPDLGGRTIRVAVENAYLPFNYIDLETNQPAGWDYDVINRICELLNCKPNYITAPWEGMIQAVADGEFDMAADGITITADRAQIVDFSIGYINIEQRFLARLDENRFSTVQEFVDNAALRLGTQSGTTNFETAQKLLPLNRIQAFDQFGFAVEALISGDVDAVIIDETAGQGYLGVNADKLKLVGESLSSDQLGFIYPKGSDLRVPFDVALGYLMANGELAAINAKFFSESFTVTYDDIADPFATPQP